MPGSECQCELQHGRLPGTDLHIEKMPGHWLLARLGKRVLRPGGLGLTRALVRELRVTAHDDVVEFAPGLGVTAGLILKREPRSYVGVERDADAAAWARRHLSPRGRIVVGSAEQTGLPDATASLVIGEAMLTMNPAEHKRRVVQEAFRLLRPGGRYGIHELAIATDSMSTSARREIESALSAAIHVGARPLAPAEWRTLVEESGLEVTTMRFAAMRLLNPIRLIADEGLAGALRFARNVMADADARRRVLAMRKVFSKYRRDLCAIALVARKP